MSDYGTYFRMIDDLKAQLAAREAEIARLTQENTQQANWIASLRTTLDKAEAEIARLRSALQRIADWNELDSGFRLDYGSKGERDFYRQLASQALAGCPKQP